MKGKIVLIPFPFTNLTTTKLRPAPVLYEGKRDVVVAFISSKIPSQLSDSDILISEEHEEFILTGLKRTSVIKLDKIATITKELIIGEIGELGPKLKRKVNSEIRKLYKL